MNDQTPQLTNTEDYENSDTQLEYSADKLQYSNSKQSLQNDEFSKRTLIEEPFYRKDLQEILDRRAQNQRKYQMMENQFIIHQRQHHQSVSTACSQIKSKMDEKGIQEVSSQEIRSLHNSQIDCDVSVIKKNISINQDLSMIHCERALQFTENNDLELKLYTLMDENSKLARMNENLFREVQQLRELSKSPEARDIQLKNNQIVELQRRVFEIEREQIEKQSEEYAQVQCLEMKTEKLEQHNQQLQNRIQQLEQTLKQKQKIGPETAEFQRMKNEFEDFQRLTQNAINQEEEYQNRIAQLEEQLCTQTEVQEELIKRIREIEQTYQQRIEDAKEQTMRDFRGQIRRLNESITTLRKQNQYLLEQLQQQESIKQNMESYYQSELDVIKSNCSQQFLQQETQMKKSYDKIIQEKNATIQQLQDQAKRNNHNEYDYEGRKSSSYSSGVMMARQSYSSNQKQDNSVYQDDLKALNTCLSQKKNNNPPVPNRNVKNILEKENFKDQQKSTINQSNDSKYSQIDQYSRQRNSLYLQNDLSNSYTYNRQSNVSNKSYDLNNSYDIIKVRKN